MDFRSDISLLFNKWNTKSPTCHSRQVLPDWVELQPAEMEYWNNAAAPVSDGQLVHLWWPEIHCLLDWPCKVVFLFYEVPQCKLYCYLQCTSDYITVKMNQSYFKVPTVSASCDKMNKLSFWVFGFQWQWSAWLFN